MKIVDAGDVARDLRLDRRPIMNVAQMLSACLTAVDPHGTRSHTLADYVTAAQPSHVKHPWPEAKASVRLFFDGNATTHGRQFLAAETRRSHRPT
jgi:hypothetical protein